MATSAGAGVKFINRGYTYQQPSLSECNEMGWTIIPAYQWCQYDKVYVSDMKQWCKNNIWWQDFVWDYSEVAFKNPADATMFRLRFA